MGKALTWEVTGSQGQFHHGPLLLPSSPTFQWTGRKQSIDILPDDVLLEIYDFVRLQSFAWSQRLWLKLVHTCRRWRHIIFSCPSCLDICLHCTHGTPVAEVLNHFPPLLLIVSYGKQQILTTKDKVGELFALQHRDRVHSIHLCASFSTLKKLFAVMDGSFPALESLKLAGKFSVDEEDEDEDEGADTDTDTNTNANTDTDTDIPRLPPTFQALHLKDLDLVRVGDIGVERMPLLTSLSGLISLSLFNIPSLSPPPSNT